MLLRHQQGCNTVTGRGFDHPSQICKQLEPVAHGGNLGSMYNSIWREIRVVEHVEYYSKCIEQGSFGSGIGTSGFK